MSKQILITGGAGFRSVVAGVVDACGPMAITTAPSYRVPFVQANLIDAKVDDMDAVEEWRQHLLQFGVWANKPVPLFPYPGSPDYTRLWGRPDEDAWERAHAHYLANHVDFSDVQDAHPRPLRDLELPAHAR